MDLAFLDIDPQVDRRLAFLDPAVLRSFPQILASCRNSRQLIGKLDQHFQRFLRVGPLEICQQLMQFHRAPRRTCAARSAAGEMTYIPGWRDFRRTGGGSFAALSRNAPAPCECLPPPSPVRCPWMGRDAGRPWQASL